MHLTLKQEATRPSGINSSQQQARFDDFVRNSVPSDRTSRALAEKEALAPVEPAQVLERLLALPVARWEWKAEPGNVKHIGPTAQDFRHSFGLGDSDKQIVTVDADGVALAAVQGLNAKLDAKLAERDAKLAEKARGIESLKRALAQLLPGR